MCVVVLYPGTAARLWPSEPLSSHLRKVPRSGQVSGNGHNF